MACDNPDVLEVNGPHPDYPSSHTDFDGVNVNVYGYVACDNPDVIGTTTSAPTVKASKATTSNMPMGRSEASCAFSAPTVAVRVLTVALPAATEATATVAVEWRQTPRQ